MWGNGVPVTAVCSSRIFTSSDSPPTLGLNRRCLFSVAFRPNRRCRDLSPFKSPFDMIDISKEVGEDSQTVDLLVLFAAQPAKRARRTPTGSVAVDVEPFIHAIIVRHAQVSKAISFESPPAVYAGESHRVGFGLHPRGIKRLAGFELFNGCVIDDIVPAPEHADSGEPTALENNFEPIRVTEPVVRDLNELLRRTATLRATQRRVKDQ